MIRVLVVDDHAVVREGLKRIIAEASGMMVGGEAADGPEALRLVMSEPWDAVVLDVTMPGRSGLDVLKEIRRQQPHLPVLILSMHGEEQYAIRALKAGAAGYMTKESASDQLVAAIRRVAGGRRHISPSLAEQLAVDIGRDTDQPLHAALSDREHEVLCLIGSGHTLSEIARRLSVSVKTVSTYRARMLDKMSMHNNAQLTHYAIRSGLVD